MMDRNRIASMVSSDGDTPLLPVASNAQTTQLPAKPNKKEGKLSQFKPYVVSQSGMTGRGWWWHAYSYRQSASAAWMEPLEISTAQTNFSVLK
jgi:hypothetical protein